MSFLNAAFLFGLVTIAIPVILHLIHRQRYPERPFTTLRFFDKTVKHNVLRQHLIDRVLLVLRVLALAALFVGLARPFWSLPLGERRRAVVILLDNSPSMARVSAGKPLFEHAREAAGRVLAHLEAGDQVALVLTSPQGDPEFKTDKRTLQRELAAQAGTPLALWTAGEQGRPYARPGLTTDAAALAQALQAMPSGISAAWVGYGGTTPEPVLEYGTARAGAALARARISAVPGELRTAMRAAARVLRRCSEGDSRMVVLSDMQKSEWRQPVADVGGMGITLVSVDTPNETVNLAVEGVLLPEREVWLGPNIVGSATICNRGNKASSAAELIVTAGDVDEPGQTTRVPVPALLPGGREQVNFPLHVMTRHRDLLCSAEVRGGGDDFPYDNTWYFQLGVRSPVSALCVNGTPSASLEERQTFYLLNALAPRAGSENTEVVAHARECDVAELKTRQLFQYGVVILAGVTTLDAADREKIRAFLNDGGGLLVFPSGKSDIDDYNAWGFLPVRLVRQESDQPVFVKDMAEDRPALGDLKERVGAGLQALSSTRWVRMEPVAGAVELAHLSSGAPALVEGRVGKGTVIISAVGGHRVESDWPLRPAFVILTRNLVRYLGRPTLPVTLEPQRQVGQGASVQLLPEWSEGTPAFFRRASHGSNPLGYEPLPWYRNGSALVQPAAQEPGPYLLTIQPGVVAGLLNQPGLGGQQTPVSVNGDPSESELEPVSAADAARLLPGAHVTTHHIPGGTSDPATDLNAGRNLWRWLLLGALLFLVAESLIGRRMQSETAH